MSVKSDLAESIQREKARNLRYKKAIHAELNLENITSELYEMYEKASMHDEKGSWQMVFGVNTIPSYRRKGYAGELIRRAIEDARAQGRKGLVLTCKDRLIPYYSKFGFVLEGVSESVHGNVVWNQMRLTFPA